MITGEFAVIRTAEPQDAETFHSLQDPECPRSAFLDRRREPVLAARDEVREMLTQKEVARGLFYALEDTTGSMRGFCALRELNPEVGYAEVVMMFCQDDDFQSPLADEAFGFLARQAFQRMRLNKVTARCMAHESAFRAFLMRNGFQSDGVQRDVLFAIGKWHNQETLSLFRSDTHFARAEDGAPDKGRCVAE